MTTRVNGYIMDNRLGFLLGDNAFVSIATNAAGVAVASTGVVAPIAQFKALYGYDPVADIGVNVTKTVDVKVDGTLVTVSESNVPVELRTIGGVVYANDAAYITAWAQQENLRRLVDTVQQRAVLMAISKAGASNSATTGVAAATRAYGQWSASIGATATNSFVTFMVERGYAFDKARANQYGQPDKIEIGQELVDELASLSLLNAAGAAVKLTAATVAVRIDRTVPTII